MISAGYALDSDEDTRLCSVQLFYLLNFDVAVSELVGDENGSVDEID